MSPSRRRATWRGARLGIPRSGSRRRAVARGGSPPRCTAWQVAHAESFACRGSVRGTCAARPRNRHDGDIEPYRHYTRSIPPPLPRSTLVSRHASRLAPPRCIARGGSPPQCVAWHPALHARPVVRTASRAPRNRFPPAPLRAPRRPPVFRRCVLRQPERHPFTILAPAASEENKFIQAVRLNGTKPPFPTLPFSMAEPLNSTSVLSHPLGASTGPFLRRTPIDCTSLAAGPPDRPLRECEIRSYKVPARTDLAALCSLQCLILASRNG